MTNRRLRPHALLPTAGGSQPDLGMYDLGHFNPEWSEHGKHNNVIMFGNGMGIYKDKHEKDPSKRFKAFGGPSCFFGIGGGADNCTGRRFRAKRDSSILSAKKLETNESFVRTRPLLGSILPVLRSIFSTPALGSRGTFPSNDPNTERLNHIEY